MYGRVALVIAIVVGATAPTVAAQPANESKAPGARPGLLSRCPNVPHARCGTIERPLDPRDPDGATITIGFELHRATNHNKPSLGTIVAVEGGPGYASTDSRDYYLDLFAPLLARRDFLLVDARGTGTSTFINCPGLESLQGDYLENVRLCGEQLGASSDLYGTALAADDLAAVLDVLGIDRVDLYGDSYGTFFGQSFAVRHPDRVRTLTLDAAYPVEDQDPWYRDLNRAMRDAFRLVCERDPGCSALGGDVIDRLAALADAFACRPARRTGLRRRRGAARRRSRRRVPLVPRRGRHVWHDRVRGARRCRAGVARTRRSGATAAHRRRADRLDRGRRAGGVLLRPLRRGDVQRLSATLGHRGAVRRSARRSSMPRWPSFAPTTPRRSPPSPSTTGWPRRGPSSSRASDGRRPTRGCHRSTVPATYPAVPTLVLVGDLDSITSSEGSRIVADRFPNSTFVQVANTGHVTALIDYSRCASNIVVEFVRTTSPGDTSCASQYQEVRTTDEFPLRLGDIAAPPGSGSAEQRRVASAVDRDGRRRVPALVRDARV